MPLYDEALEDEIYEDEEDFDEDEELEDDEEEDFEEEDSEDVEEDEEEDEEEDSDDEDFDLMIDGKNVKYSDLVNAYRAKESGDAKEPSAFEEIGKFYEKDNLVKFVVDAVKQGYRHDEITQVLAEHVLKQAKENVDEFEELSEEDLNLMTKAEKQVYFASKKAYEEAQAIKKRLEAQDQQLMQRQLSTEIGNHNDKLLYGAIDYFKVKFDGNSQAHKNKIYAAVNEVLGEGEHLMNKKLTERQAQTIIKIAFGDKKMASKQKTSKSGIDMATRRKLQAKAGRVSPGSGSGKQTSKKGSTRNPETMSSRERADLFRQL